MAGVQFKYCSDWCHFCGNRKEMYFVEVWMYNNQEHPDLNQSRRYFRLCEKCVDKIYKLLHEEINNG